MSPKSFWMIFFLYYCSLEILCLLFGIAILPRYFLGILPGLVAGITFFSMLIEGWIPTLPLYKDKKWHHELGYVGIVYPVPLMIALAGRINTYLVFISAILFVLPVCRLLLLKLRYLGATS